MRGQQWSSFTLRILKVLDPVKTMNGKFSSSKPGIGPIDSLFVLCSSFSSICFFIYQFCMIKRHELQQQTTILLRAYSYTEMMALFFIKIASFLRLTSFRVLLSLSYQTLMSQVLRFVAFYSSSGKKVFLHICFCMFSYVT